MTSLSPITCTLTLLGCGTSTGVPLPGCDCSVCTSTNPRNQRLRTAAHLRTSSGLSLLIDAGPDLRQQALRAHIRHIDAVLFTHAHADHILGIDDLRAFNFTAKKAIPCYASETTTSGIRSIFEYVFSPNPLYQGSSAKLELNRIEPGIALQLGGIEILPLEVIHGKLPVTMYRCGPIAYATDCNAIPQTTRDQLAGVEVLLLDGLRSEPHPAHFTIEEASELGRSLGIPRTILIHLSHTVDYNNVSSHLPEGVELGFDGLQISWTAFSGEEPLS